MATTVAKTPRTRPAIGQRVAANRLPLVLLTLAVLIWLLYLVMPNLNSSVQAFFQQWLPLVTLNTCMVFVICAVGLNIVVGYAGLLDLGYVAFWAIGGYVAAWIMSTFFYQVHVSFFGTSKIAVGIHINPWIVLVVAAAFCALWGLIIGAPTLRLKSDYLAIVTLGFGEMIPEFFRNSDSIAGVNVANGQKGIRPIDLFGLAPIHAIIPKVPAKIGTFNNDSRFAVFVVLAGIVIFVSLRIREGRLGRAWLAIREDELAASMMGVPLMRSKLAAYAVGAACGGIGGVAFSSNVAGVDPTTFAFSISIGLLSMVVLGGMGNVWGVVVGALILSWINERGLAQVGNAVNDSFGTHINFPSFNYLIFGLILVLMMLFRREGLFPERRTKALLREQPRTEAEAIGADMEDMEPVSENDIIEEVR